MINSLGFRRGRRESTDRLRGNVARAIDWLFQRRTVRGVNGSTTPNRVSTPLGGSPNVCLSQPLSGLTGCLGGIN